MSEGRKKPVLALCGVLLPLLGAVGAYVAASLTPGLAAIAVLLVLTIAGVALGAVAALLAMWRRERWFGLQAWTLLVNAGVLLWAASHFVGQPAPVAPPQGEVAYLLLAPPESRMDDAYIGLAYPAPPGTDPAGYVVGKRDERGVVTSFQIARHDTPVGLDELRMQLTARGGRWVVRSDGTHIRHLPARRWKTARYMELRVLPNGWAVPVDALDSELLPLGAPR